MLKQIIFLTVLLMFSSPLFLKGEIIKPLITYIVDDDSLTIYHSRIGQVFFNDVVVDSTKIIWVYSYNPFDFRKGELRDTVDEDSIRFKQSDYWAIYSINVFYSSSFNTGKIQIASNNLLLPGENIPRINVLFPNPNNGCFDFKIESNAYFARTFGESHYQQGVLNNNEITFNICSMRKGLYYIFLRLKFNHPLLRESVHIFQVLII